MHPTKKWIKRLVLVLAIIPLLIFLAFVGAISFIDFNGYKPQIEQEVKDYTGRDFKIEGSIEVSVLPFTFSVGKSILSQPEAFAEQPPQLTLKQVEIELSMWQLLLNKRLQVKAIELVEPQLSLDRDVKGRDNWSDLPHISQLLPLLPSGTQPTNAVLRPMHVPSNMPFVANAYANHPQLPWSLQSLVVTNASLKLNDQQEKYQIALNKLNLFALDIQPDKPFELRGDFAYHHSLSPRTIDFRITTALQMDSSLELFQFNDWQGLVKVALKEEYATPQVHLTTKGSVIKINLRKRRIQMEQLHLSGLNGELQTNFTGNFGAQLDLQGELAAKQLDLPSWSKHLALPLAQKDDPQWQMVNGEYRWQWQKGAIEIKPYNAEELLKQDGQ